MEFSTSDKRFPWADLVLALIRFHTDVANKSMCTDAVG